MRNLVAGLVVLVLAGCGSAPAKAVISSAPAAVEPASPAREASPSASQPAASTTAWKLPVALTRGTQTATAGFVSLLDGSFSPDHQGDLANSSVGNPPLKGTTAGTNFAMVPSYDLPQQRWVPVSLQQVTPDGAQYAYAEWVMPTGPINGPTPPASIRIHVVDVSAARDQVVYATSRQLLTVVAFLPEGIYVTDQCWEGCGGVGGMWLLNPSTGQLATILPADSDHTDWRMIGNGVAWGIGPWGLDQIGDTVFRLDISTRSVTPWSTPAKSVGSVGLVGLDSQGFPLVEAQDNYTGAVELWDETSTATGFKVYASPNSIHFSAPISGPCGTWIGSTNGVFELLSSGVLQPLDTSVAVYPVELVVAGPCIAA